MTGTLLNPYGFGSPAGAAFAAAMLAAAPDYWYRMNSYSSGFADSSGNGRDANSLSGVAPTIASDGPKLALSGQWGSSAGYLNSTYSLTSPTTGTYHTFLKAAANPAADLCIQTVCPILGNVNGGCQAVYLLSNGKIRLFLYNGSSINLDTTSAITLNTWLQVVAKWGAGGAQIRINKVNAATGATTSATAIASCRYRLHGYYNGSSDVAQTGAVQLAESAFWSSKQADAVTDGLYDAA